MQRLEHVAGELALADRDLDPIVLAAPEVADKVAVTLRLTLRISVGLVAGQLLDVLGVVVADKRPEAALVGGLARVGLAELDALGVLARLLGAALPGVKDLEGLVVVLGDDEARVEVVLAELVLVVVLGGVRGEGEGVGLGGEAPVVHQPFKGEVHVVEEGVGVDKDAHFVVSENLRHDGGFLP